MDVLSSDHTPDFVHQMLSEYFIQNFHNAKETEFIGVYFDIDFAFTHEIGNKKLLLFRHECRFLSGKSRDETKYKHSMCFYMCTFLLEVKHMQTNATLSNDGTIATGTPFESCRIDDDTHEIQIGGLNETLKQAL